MADEAVLNWKYEKPPKIPLFTIEKERGQG
jgi:hypothetical protein